MVCVVPSASQKVMHGTITIKSWGAFIVVKTNRPSTRSGDNQRINSSKFVSPDIWAFYLKLSLRAGMQLMADMSRTKIQQQSGNQNGRFSHDRGWGIVYRSINDAVKTKL